MPLLDNLLNVLRSRPTRTRLEQRASVHEGDDGEHLGRGAELEDGEEVGEVVTENIPSD
jgi:hypothetical protein